MSTRNLQSLLSPRSVVIVGASQRPGSVGSAVLKNVREAGFGGPSYAVNPKHKTLLGEPCYPTIGSLPEVPELAVICTPPPTLPGLLEQLAAAGARAAVVLTAGLGKRDGHLCQEMLDATRPAMLRILGPNCLGVISPHIALNASFAASAARPGSLAFVSQSGALASAMLDWARSRNLGFSHFVSLGDSLDVDVADVLDFLAGDARTHAILLYVEAIQNGRKFMSAARAAARIKPVLIVKAGRSPEAALAAATHTGALAGRDDVYDAAIRRAGMLRVDTTDALFDAVETLTRAQRVGGNRVAILTNGGGAGVMATDALIAGGGKLAALSGDTLSALDRVLPPSWSRGNPVDMLGDASISRYMDAARILAGASEADAVLLLHAPTAIVRNGDIATVVVSGRKPQDLPLFSAWLGAEAVVNDRNIFRAAGIPTYDTPEQAVRGILQVVEYRRNLELLSQTPPAMANDLQLHLEKARAVVGAARTTARTMLSEHESKELLADYGIGVAATICVDTAERAAEKAAALGFPVVLKIVSPDITHKSAVGGVALDLHTPDTVRIAARAMVARVTGLSAGARIEGFTVQRMVRPADGIELILGVFTDPVFGPIILFGHGGTAVSQINDYALALPPLNHVLAEDLVKRTRVALLLERCGPAARDGVISTLMRLSSMVCDMADIVELDINPLMASAEGVIALDARIALTPTGGEARAPLAIVPYPRELESHVRWRDAPLLVRPIRPEDEGALKAFFMHLSAEDIHARYFATFKDPGHSQLARLTQIDYAREMAFVAIAEDPHGASYIVGEVRVVTDPDNIDAQFGVVVRSDCKGRGLGTMLVSKLVSYLRTRGTAVLSSDVLSGNLAMLNIARRAGFMITRQASGDVIELRLPLAADTTCLPCGAVTNDVQDHYSAS